MILRLVEAYRTLLGDLNRTRVDSSIRRYCARFCNDLANSKLTHYADRALSPVRQGDSLTRLAVFIEFIPSLHLYRAQLSRPCVIP
jgi:hypothetical protein